MLRNDALSSWEAGGTVALAKGEVAIATLSGGQLAEIRIGTGNSSWADSLKLNIGTDQVSGLAEMISSLVGDGAKKYQVVAGSESNSWKLQEAPLSGGSWTDVSGSDWTVDFSSLTAELCGISAQLTADIGAISAGVDVVSAGVDVVSGAVDVVSGAVDYLSSEVSACMKSADFAAISTTIGLDAASDTNKVVTLSDIAELAGAMHFKGAVASLAEIESAEPGDVVIISSTSKEYVYNGAAGAAYSVDNWVELGDEILYATKAEVSEISSGLTSNIDYLSGGIDYLSGGIDYLSGELQATSAAAVTSAYGMASAYTNEQIEALGLSDYALSTDVDTLVNTTVAGLSVGAAEGGNADAGFVTIVTEENGKVAVTKKEIYLSDIVDVASISANIGLSNYALSADVTALVSETSAAVVGEAEDLSSANTVYGAKAYAKDYADKKMTELSSGYLILDCGGSALREGEPATPLAS